MLCERVLPGASLGDNSGSVLKHVMRYLRLRSTTGCHGGFSKKGLNVSRKHFSFHFPTEALETKVQQWSILVLMLNIFHIMLSFFKA